MRNPRRRLTIAVLILHSSFCILQLASVLGVGSLGSEARRRPLSKESRPPTAGPGHLPVRVANRTGGSNGISIVGGERATEGRDETGSAPDPARAGFSHAGLVPSSL